jgi:carbon monoxide dehydrogenase subunit G
MQIAGEYTFDAPQEMVWKALRDPEVLGTIMPGGEGFEEVGESENQYAGILNVKVGPVQGKFQGNIQLSDIIEPESYTMAVDGKGPQGFVKANGRLHLTPQGEQTHMVYEGNAQVGGRIASVGQRLLDSSAKSIIRQSLEGLNQYLKFQMASGAATANMTTTDVVPAAAEIPPGEVVSGEAIADVATSEEATSVAPMAPTTPPPLEMKGPTPISEYKPPSQTEVALNVAKDVAGDLVPPHYRPVVIGVTVLIILLIIFLIYRALT